MDRQRLPGPSTIPFPTPFPTIPELSLLLPGKQLALVKTSSAVRTCGFDFGGNIIMFSTDKQMGYQCFVSFFDLRDPSQIGEEPGLLQGSQGGGECGMLDPSLRGGVSDPFFPPQRTTSPT